MPENGPKFTPEVGPKITPKTPENPSLPKKGRTRKESLDDSKNSEVFEYKTRAPQEPPKVDKKYRTEGVGKQENVEEEIRKEKEKINEEFNEKKSEKKESHTPEQKHKKGSLYEILGVSQESSDEEIKRAYRKAAKEYHPDRNPGDKEAEARFKEIQDAYDILSDTEKRWQYDNVRTAEYKWEEAESSKKPEGQYYQEEKPLFNSDFNNIFDNILGGIFKSGWEKYKAQQAKIDFEKEILENSEKLKEEYYQSAVQDRWEKLSDLEKEDYQVYTAEGKKLGEKENIRAYQVELEKKRNELGRRNKLFVRVSKDFFYSVLQDFAIEDSQRKKGWFGDDNIEVPRLDGDTEKMSQGMFLRWMRGVERNFDEFIRNEAITEVSKQQNKRKK